MEFLVKDEHTHLPSPFTQPLTASMVRMKEIQTKEKAHPKGTSKILAKARKKALEEEEAKKGHVSFRPKKIMSCFWNIFKGL